MARVEIVMPQMGESITNGTIKKWNKNIGEVVELDEIILEIFQSHCQRHIQEKIKTISLFEKIVKDLNGQPIMLRNLKVPHGKHCGAMLMD